MQNEHVVIQWKWTESGRIWECPDCHRFNSHGLVPVARCNGCGSMFQHVRGAVDDRRLFPDSCGFVAYGYTRVPPGELAVISPVEADEGEG